jgi:Short C-terminal domain
METRSLAPSIVGYLAGVALGTACLTLVFLGMRSVMDVGGACADGGPYVSAQPCPDGAALALTGGIFGLVAAAGLMIWFGSRLGGGYVSLVFLGWPALFISLGFNFLQYGFDPPGDVAGPEWGFLIPGVMFWAMGGIPLLFGIWGWREARGGRAGAAAVTVNRLRSSITLPSSRIEFAPNASGAPRPVNSGPVPAPAPAPSPASAPSGDVDELLVSQLERLGSLHASGALTDDEFAVAKARILANESLDG